VYKQVSPTTMLRVEQVTVTFTNPRYRPPESGSYSIYYRYWRRPEASNPPTTWVNADLNRPGWAGQGVVAMTPDPYQTSSTFWLRPAKANPIIELVGTDQPFVANSRAPAYGVVQHAPTGCAF
jgi:hypothetical protein